MENIKNYVKMGALKIIKMAADEALASEANSVSCILMYQPKAPKGIEQFKRTHKGNEQIRE